jgi:hypothetical protein
MAATLFFSLLNTVCGYQPVALLPYTHYLLSDDREPLVDACLQLLLAVTDYRPAPQP